MKNISSIIVTYIAILLISVPAIASAQEDGDAVIYSGYFSREQNDGEMARMSGKSHYVKFYPENRFIRLYIPYPFSTTVKPEAILKVFEKVYEKAKSSVYIKDDFGILDEKVIAHVDVIRRIDDEIMFDCGFSAPCRIVFAEDKFRIIKKGIVKDHITFYYHVAE